MIVHWLIHGKAWGYHMSSWLLNCTSKHKKKLISPTSFLILLLVNLYCNWNCNSLTTRDFKVRSLAICVVQAASSSGPKSFIFAICYWWKRLYPKWDLKTQIRGLIPSASLHYKDKPHSSTCPLLPNIRVHDQYGTVGLGITPCYHVLSLPGLYTLHLCTLHYVLLLYIHTQSLHYTQIHDGRTIDRAVNGAIATPSSGSFLGWSLGEFTSGELALREVPLCALIVQPMIHIHLSVTMR